MINLEVLTKKEAKKLKALVSLLETSVMDEIEIGYFLLKDNKLYSMMQNDNKKYKTPSKVLKKVIKMARLISKNQEALKTAIEERDWDLCSSPEETEKADKYSEIFDVEFNVWESEVIDRLFLSGEL